MSFQLQTIGIVVAPMGKALHFYRTLGLSIPEGLDHEDNVEFKAPNGITLGFLTLAMAEQSDPHFKTPAEDSMDLQFLCDSPAEVYIAILNDL